MGIFAPQGMKQVVTDEKLNAELIARGKELNFHPDFMRVRYENWVHRRAQPDPVR